MNALHFDCPDYSWQTVTCDRCERTYQCTPQDDHYCTAEGDHCCEACLLRDAGVPLIVLETGKPLGGPQ